jgi:two-component system response regulator HydG
MKGMNGVELCRRILEIRSSTPVILITAFGTMDAAIGAIRAGAYDFIPKPFEIDQLVLALDRAMTFASLKAEVLRLKRAVADTQRFDEIIGTSPAITQLFGVLAKVAQSDAPVLVTGESGTGKELVARAIHHQGARAKGQLVAVNCAAMPENLLESELFGHAKGAFTDARSAKVGLFQAAHGGTIFLDEIGDLPLGLQPKLLRALQERVIRPVGGTTELPFDARVISATNRDLETMVEEHVFREDLFFRINVIPVALPPLRARGGDVLLLAQHFLERIAARANKPVTAFSPEAAAKLMAYSWPGNVRELQNCVERAVALASFAAIEVSDLPDKVRAFKSSQIVIGGDDPTELVSLEELEKRYTQRVLESVAGNKSAAARILQIERKTLHRMLARWGLTDSPEKS